jgi:hypothetical protein
MTDMSIEPRRPKVTPVAEEDRYLTKFDNALKAFNPTLPRKVAQFAEFRKIGAGLADRHIVVFQKYCAWAYEKLDQLVVVVDNKDRLINLLDAKIASLAQAMDELKLASSSDSLEERLTQLRDAVAALEKANKRADERLALENR